MDLKNIPIICFFYSSLLENCQINISGGFTCNYHITSIFGYNCLSSWFCSCIFHFANLCSKQLQYIYQCCIQKKFEKISFSWGSWGAKSRALVGFSKYKTNNTCAGLKCILFILNVEIY